ncbi:hypothetical protein BJ742DRAFT_740552 [Cladochytrium replicatum]|nr:hypothetical protein BJ742DRAFT_740552 [Cladochytrium replicatum]
MVDIVILVAMDHPLSFANDIEALGVTLVQVKPILFPELRYGVSSKDRIECTDGPPAKDQITDEAGFDVCGQLNVGAEEENPVKESIRTRKGECGLQVVGQRQGNTRSSSPLAKVYAWGLTDYELVIFIGLDYTVVKPIDELLVNHEVIVDEDMEEERREKTIRRETFKMLTLAIRDYKESDRNDSGFFNAVFPQWEENHLMQLPISYAAQSHTLQQNGEPSGAIWDRWNRTWFAASLLTANDSSLLKISVNQVHPPVYIEGLGLASIVHNVIDYQSVCHNFAMTEDSWPIVPDQYLRKLINSFHENALQFLGESRNSSSFIGNYNPRNVLQIDSNICEKANTKAFQNHSDLQLGPELDLQSGIGTSSPKTSVIPEDEKWAFVTSISDDSDIDSENLIWAEILFQSWRKKHRPEDWQFVMIIPSSLSEHKKKRLMRIGYMLRETECLESLDMNLTTPQEEKNHLTCSECFAGPVHAFGLAEYTKVVYLDIKSLVERSLKWIFMINPGNSPIGARLPYVNMIGTSVLLLKPIPLSLQSRIRQLIKESKYQIRKNLFTLRLQRISDLQDWIFKEVGPLVPKNERFALVDFPDHPNVGDHAIWLGEELFFKKLNTSPSFYCTAYESGSYRKNGNDCDFTKLRSVIGQNGTIFCHGGGNIRNIPGESEIGYFQAFRLSLIKAFPTNPIVILPQSINFEQNLGTKALSQTAEVFNSHKQLTLMTWRS